MIKRIRKIILAVILIPWAACEELPDEVIDNSSVEYSYERIDIPEKIILSGSENFIDIYVQFDAFQNVERVFFTIEDENNRQLTSEYLPLKQDGKIFTEEFILDENFTPGIYFMNLFVEDISGSLTKSIVHKFILSAEENIAPFLSNLSAPDTVDVQTPKSVIRISVNAEDENGADDIDDVYFIVFRPDSSTSGNRTFMFDDGDSDTHGDDTADDGIYSVIVEVTPANQMGKYTFDFYAVDKSGLRSSKLTHFIYLR